MRTYIKMQQDKERVEKITQEWLDFCERDHKIHMGIGFSIGIFILGLVVKMWYEGLLIF